MDSVSLDHLEGLVAILKEMNCKPGQVAQILKPFVQLDPVRLQALLGSNILREVAHVRDWRDFLLSEIVFAQASQFPLWKKVICGRNADVPAIDAFFESGGTISNLDSPRRHVFGKRLSKMALKRLAAFRDIPPINTVTDVPLALVSAKDLGINEPVSRKMMYEEARSSGLSLCPVEAAFELAKILVLDGESCEDVVATTVIGEDMYLGMDVDSRGIPNIKISLCPADHPFVQPFAKWIFAIPN